MINNYSFICEYIDIWNDLQILIIVAIRAIQISYSPHDWVKYYIQKHFAAFRKFGEGLNVLVVVTCDYSLT